MSGRRRRQGGTHPRNSGAGAPLVTRAASPADVIGVVPYLLGFWPSESIVVVSLVGPRKRFGAALRLDLFATMSQPGRVMLVEQVVAIARAHGWDRLLLLAFCDDPTRAEAQVRDLLLRVEGAGIAVEDAFCTSDTRWWSYTCDNPRCCPSEGTTFDLRTTRGAAAAVWGGLSYAPSRRAVEESFGPAEPGRCRAVAEHVVRRRASGLDHELARPGATAEYSVQLAARLGAQPGPLDPAEAARLALAVQDVLVRDEVIGAIERGDAATHLELWREITRLVDDDLLAAVGCVAAFAAWLSGNGACAVIAVERVLAAEPGYRLARLLSDLLTHAVDPARWPTRGGSDPSAAVAGLAGG
jgi:hypothetical protein